jgi:hypothetical protein
MDLEQYSVRGKKRLHGRSKIAEQGDGVIETLDFLVFG